MTISERQAHNATAYCQVIADERARHAQLKAGNVHAGERSRVARGIGALMRLVADLANSIEARASEES